MWFQFEMRATAHTNRPVARIKIMVHEMEMGGLLYRILLFIEMPLKNFCHLKNWTITQIQYANGSEYPTGIYMMFTHRRDVKSRAWSVFVNSKFLSWLVVNVCARQFNFCVFLFFFVLFSKHYWRKQFIVDAHSSKIKFQLKTCHSKFDVNSFTKQTHIAIVWHAFICLFLF